jgi:hypothetical protein
MNQMVTRSLQQQLIWRQIIKLLNEKQKTILKMKRSMWEGHKPHIGI